MTYVVQPGDTLWSIAARFGTTVQAIMQANQLTDPNFVYAGLRLFIPVPGPGPGPGPIYPPGPPADRELERRVTRLEREVTRLNNQVERLDRRVDRLERP
ncbi:MULTISPECIES: LysM domain-containing protein [unclassified Paenibacillus]|uniref:LysM peptidoglycan-binding domain-containing protein n=1 Tax=unclassified Paenibacillus TaxID=185978 RepID=UPI00278A47BF|nr:MULTISPECIES: LysM domain-containing protein [unclassified Paenibacillus]MDQ0899045.1 LysM repeat protein [Paenibacillus sp. V4I7]MDQ0914970.1 LysM repeat protein [Paenibacillus sp. V4I5]